MEIITETMKMVATKFATWIEDYAWKEVYSKELNRRAYIDTSKYDILVNGSDFHYTKLVRENGKSVDEIYEMFVVSERARLKIENKIII